MSLSARALPPLELLGRVAARLRAAVPYRGAGWLLTDPATLLNTAFLPEGVPAHMTARLVEEEIFGSDVASFRSLARARSPVTTLSAATGGDLSASHRHRTLYAPHGFGDELRAVFRTGWTVWGQVCLARGEGEPPFSPAEVALVRSVAPAVGAGLRAAMRLIEAGPASPEPRPGVVVLDDGGGLESLTAEAAALLAGAPALEDGLPIAVHEVAHRTRAVAGGRGDGAPPRAAMPSATGWLYLHGARLGANRTAIVVERPVRPTLAPLTAAMYGLSGREREVAALWVQGLDVAEVARRLFISPHTVHDHVKAIYRKLHVTSRGELTATLLRIILPGAPST